jgi:hypothetical protein
MKRVSWGFLVLGLCVQPSHAFGIVCKAVPSAVYDPSTAPIGPAAAVPADLEPKRDDWARRTAAVAVKIPAPQGASGAAETTVAEAAISPETGAVSVNGQPLGGSPADMPKHVIVCKAVKVDK